MKYITTLILAFVFTSFVFVNCGQTSNRSRKPVTSIQLEPKKSSYKAGENITANFQTKLKDGELDNIEISIDGKVLKQSKTIDNTLSINTSEMSVGLHTIKVLVKKTDGKEGENYQNFTILSDIVPEKYGYKITATYPHSTSNFTEGLEFHNGFLYEGTGQEGHSAIFKIDFKTGKVVKEHKLENKYFGEGITILNDKIYQLTYTTQVGFVYDLNSFELLKTWNYRQKQGWGMTNDGKSLIMSDGTENIYFINPENLAEERTIQVCTDKEVVKNINELEYINGEIWANIWTTEKIIRFDPKTGKVLAEIDFKGISGLVPHNQQQEMDVFNGIAHNPATGKIYVTGKMWPKLFEIELVKK